MSSPTHDDIRTNAYVDGELDPYERAALLEELVRNPERSREVAELGELNELVRLAFERVPDAPQEAAIAVPNIGRVSGVRRTLSAALALALLISTFGAGWLARGSSSSREYPLAALPAVPLAASSPPAPGVLLLLASFNGEKLDSTLRRTRELLERNRGSNLKVEVVVTGMAVKYLRRGFSPYNDEFAELMRRYPSLRIVACAATLQALSENGRSLRLIKEVNMAPTAVEEVVNRLHEGWVYIET